MIRLPLRLRLPMYGAAIVGLSLTAFAYFDLAADRYHLTSKLDATMLEETHWVSEYLSQHSLNSSVAHFGQIFSQIGHVHDFQIVDPHGTPVFQTCRVMTISIPQLPQSRNKSTLTFNVSSNGYRLIDLPIRTSANEEVWLRTVGSTKDIEEHISFLRLYNLAAVPTIALLAALGGLFISQVLLRPISDLAESAKKLSTEDGFMRFDETSQVDEVSYLTKVLNETLGKLQQSSQKMSQFTADAAHELRSPVAAIRLLSETALSVQNSPEHSLKAMKAIHIESVHMSELITQLLTITRLESAQRSFCHEVVRVDYVLQSLFETFESLAREKQIVIKVLENVEWEVLGDRVLLRQMLANLLENAVKYTPAGGKITLSSRSVDETCRISISDSGVGITAHHLERIFDRFYRVDGSRNVNSGGHGLGLAICRAIVQSMQGVISATSEPGFGTTFIVCLPGNAPEDSSILDSEPADYSVGSSA